MTSAIVNLTPHTVVVLNADGSVRVALGSAGDGFTVPAVRTTFGDLVGLPAPVAGTTYLVSSIVFAAATAQGRTDVACPADLVRDDQGRVIGCRALQVV